MALEPDVVKSAVLIWMLILDALELVGKFKLLHDILLEHMHGTQWNQPHHGSDLQAC